MIRLTDWTLAASAQPFSPIVDPIIPVETPEDAEARVLSVFAAAVRWINRPRAEQEEGSC